MKIDAESEECRDVVYRPNQSVYLGWAVWVQMTSELRQSRELIWRLFLRGFRARYRQSLLGYFWAILIPLATTAVFFILNRARVITPEGMDMPLVPFALFNLSIWSLFATGISAATNSLVTAGSMIVKINFPKETLVIAAYAQGIVECLIRAALATVSFAYFGLVPEWTVIFVPLLLLPLILLGLGLGLMLSMLNGLLRDTGEVIGTVLTLIMLLSPVLYPLPQDGIFAYNPLAQILNACRDATLKGSLSDPLGYGGAALLCLGIFVAGWRFFHVAELRIAERI